MPWSCLARLGASATSAPTARISWAVPILERPSLSSLAASRCSSVTIIAPAPLPVPLDAPRLRAAALALAASCLPEQIAGNTEATKEVGMAKDHGPSVKDDKQYEGLRKKGMSKSRAAAIANSEGSSSRGGKSSGSSRSRRSSGSGSGGNTAQKKAAGRKGGKKSS